MAIASAANLNPARQWPSLLEPVRGPVPGIAGKGIANFIGPTWAAR